MKLRTLTIAVIAAASAVAIAQGGNPRPPGQAGPGGQPVQRQGGFGMGRSMGSAFILMRADVQKELKLTATQKSTVEKKMQALMPKPGAAGQRPDFKKLSDQAKAVVKSTLTAAQYKRYEELSLQMQGAGALGRDDIAAKLGLTAAQKQKIQTISKSAGDQMRQTFEKNRNNPDAARKAAESLRTSTNTKVLAVLTPAQKAKWLTMIGKPFTFQRQQRTRPPGG